MIQKHKIIPPGKIRDYLRRRESEGKIGNSSLDGSPTKANHLPLPIRAKREAIFNPELKTLVERVKSPNHAFSLNLRKEDIYKKFQNLVPPEKKEEHKLLHAVYCPKKNIQESAIIDYTAYILERVGVSIFSWNFLSHDSNAYFSEMSQGVDIITKKSFMFMKKDPNIIKKYENVYYLQITKELLQDPFFQKKFSVESLGYYYKLYFFFLNHANLDACLVAFLDRPSHSLLDATLMEMDSESEDKSRNRWLKMVEDKIQNLVPALKRYRNEKLIPRIIEDDMLASTLYHFKTMVGEGSEKFYAHNIRIRKYPDPTNAYFFKKQFLSNIYSFTDKKDKIIETDASSFLLLSEKNYRDTISSIADQDGLDVDVRANFYPDYGENILVYL